MDFDGNFRNLGTCDVSALAQRVAGVTDDEWSDDRWRQEQFETHQTTESLPLLYDRDFRHENPTRQAAWDRFVEDIGPILDALASTFKEGAPIRILLVRLSQKSFIAPHQDGGTSLPFVHRIHIPVITEQGVLFSIDGEDRHLAAGEIWEINNCRVHGVLHDGGAPRVHLIVDWVTPQLLELRKKALS